MQTPVRKQQRNSNIELYRIAVMLLIIAHHYVVNSGLLAADGPVYADLLCARSQFLLLFGAFGKTGINCFTMITGYYMCTSRISLRKYVKLLFQIAFYKIVIYLIFLVLGREALLPVRIMQVILPATALGTGYVGCFVLFYLLIPFLNVLIANLSKKQHGVLVLALLAMHSGIALLPDGEVTINYVGWFCVVYLLAAYIRLHPGKRDENFGFWGWMTVISFGLSVASVMALSFVRECVTTISPYWLLNDAHKILAVTNGVTSFMLFKNLRVPHSSLVNRLGGAAFGVLMIHAGSEAMRQWLWSDLLQVVPMYESPFLVLYAILCVAAIYIVCALIEWLRLRVAEQPFMRLWDRCLQDKVINFYEKTLCRWIPMLRSE